jgi:hypothetical protein
VGYFKASQDEVVQKMNDVVLKMSRDYAPPKVSKFYVADSKVYANAFT